MPYRTLSVEVDQFKAIVPPVYALWYWHQGEAVLQLTYFCLNKTRVLTRDTVGYNLV